jgi:hypothetical protein
MAWQGGEPTVTTKLIKHGEGWAVALDDELLASLHIGPQTPLEVTSDGASLSIKPIDGPKASFERALERVNARHGGALKKLAE